MFVFDNSEDLDIATYEYRLYTEDQVEADPSNPGYYRLDGNVSINSGTITPYRQGFNLANVFTVSVENSTTTSTTSTTSAVSYYGAIRGIDTSTNAGPWTLIKKTSTDTPLIDEEFIGSLTAAKITTGTIGAAEITLNGANSIIKSSNYSAGLLGWKITGLGDAEFNELTVRTALDIGGSDASSFHVDINGNMWLGASTYTTSPFRISNTGNVDVGGTDASSFHIDNTGNIWAGAGTFNTSTNPFYVTAAGVLKATGATVDGTITSTNGRIGPFDITASGMNSIGYNSQNYMQILNYGDISVFSAPLTGGHAGMRHQTDLVGEYIQVSRTDMATNRYITLGSSNGAPGNIGIEIVENNSSRFRVYQDGNVTFSGNLNGYSFTSGRHDTANLMVHTDGNGYLQVGYINSLQGYNENIDASPDRVWGSNGGTDSYLRTYRTSALSVGTAAAVSGPNVTGHVFNSTTGIRFPGPLNTSYPNMPSDFNFSLNFQYSNTGGLMYALVNGDNNAVRNWATSGPSDRRLKEKINPNVSSHLEKFYELTAYEFEFNEKMPIVGGKYIPTGEKEIGLIAQEVKEIFPNMVLGQEEEDSYLQINYQQFCKLLIAASLDQNKRIEKLSSKVEELESRLI
jgi:hypothetical protein